MINTLISIKNAIINAQDYLGIDHDKDVPFFTNLATEAEKKIGSRYQLERKKSVLTITDCIAPIPNDAVKIEIAVMGNLGENCDNMLAQVVSGLTNNVTNVNSNGLFLVVDINSTDSGNAYPAFGYVQYTIQNNKILFDQSYCDQQVTIQYLALKRDCDGFIEVGQNHIEAITWYIIFRYLFRKSTASYIERDKMMLAKQEWERTCANSRAVDADPTFSEHRDMVRLFHDPYSGIGLWQGMNSTLGVNYSIW